MDRRSHRTDHHPQDGGSYLTERTFSARGLFGQTLVRVLRILAGVSLHELQQAYDQKIVFEFGRVSIWNGGRFLANRAHALREREVIVCDILFEAAETKGVLAGKQLGFSKKLQAQWASKKVVLQLFHPGGHVGFHFQFPPEEGIQLFFSFFSILSFWQQKLSSLTSFRQELLVIMLHFCGGASVPSGARRQF